MNRIIISNGSFSSLIASSIFTEFLNKNDNNFFLGYLKRFSKTSCKNIFEASNLLVPYKKFLLLGDYKSYFNFNYNKLIQDIDHLNIDEIYIPINSTTKKWYYIFKNYFKNAKIILYEEGLMSYVKVILDSKLKRIMKSTENYYVIYYPKLLFMLQHHAPNIIFKTIKKNAILNNLETIKNNITLNLPTVLSDKKYALVLPQYYYQNSKNKTNQILSLYHSAIQKLIEDNYIVIFKDHPKAAISYSTELKKYFKPDIFIILNDMVSIPVEVVVSSLNIKTVFSAYSTSLFTIDYLFGIQPLTSYKLLKHRMNIFSIYPLLLCLLTQYFVKDIYNVNRASEKTDNIFVSKNIIFNLYIKMLALLYR